MPTDCHGALGFSSPVDKTTVMLAGANRGRLSGLVHHFNLGGDIREFVYEVDGPAFLKRKFDVDRYQ